jgi:hypothetical protein
MTDEDSQPPSITDRWIRGSSSTVLIAVGIALAGVGFASDRSDSFVAALVIVGSFIVVIGVLLPRIQHATLSTQGLSLSLRNIRQVSKEVEDGIRVSDLEPDTARRLLALAADFPTLVIATERLRDAPKRAEWVAKVLSRPGGPTGPAVSPFAEPHRIRDEVVDLSDLIIPTSPTDPPLFADE